MWSKLPVLSTTQQFLFCILITWGFDKTADSPGGFGFASLMRSKLRLGADIAGRAAMNLSRSKSLCAWSQRLLRSAQRRFFNNGVRLRRTPQARVDWTAERSMQPLRRFRLLGLRADSK